MFLELSGSVAVVTGAARGIGFAIAERLSGAGARVVIADVSEGGATAAAERLRETGGEAVGVAADVTAPDEVTIRFDDEPVAAGSRGGPVRVSGPVPLPSASALADEVRGRVISSAL